jgi:hypothetical protein
MTLNREEKITPAERGILFPPQKTKNSFSGGHQKIPCQHRVFPVSERFGKKKYRNSVNFFYSVQKYLVNWFELNCAGIHVL